MSMILPEQDNKPTSSAPMPAEALLYHMGLEAVQDGYRWWPDGRGMDLFHCALGMCGEVGEVANVVKKVQRGDLDIKDPAVRERVLDECADVFTYLLEIFGQLRADMYLEYYKKRAKNEARWGTKPKGRLPQFVLDEAAGRDSKPQTWQTPGEFAS